MQAQLLAEALDAWAASRRATMLAAIIEGMSSLLVTEGNRRRHRLELEYAAGADSVLFVALSVVTDLQTRFRVSVPPDDGDGAPAS
jgi:hypothetical protein